MAIGFVTNGNNKRMRISGSNSFADRIVRLFNSDDEQDGAIARNRREIVQFNRAVLRAKARS
jgi:hypothetical protein